MASVALNEVKKLFIKHDTQTYGVGFEEGENTRIDAQLFQQAHG